MPIAETAGLRQEMWEQSGLLRHFMPMTRASSARGGLVPNAVPDFAEITMADRGKILRALTGLCKEMAENDRVSCICLGCTAMFSIYEELKKAVTSGS